MPVLHLLAGPNGAGKTTFYERVLGPVLHLPFINADAIARQHWPGDELLHAYLAAREAAAARTAALEDGRSFVTETVFSHPSKLALLQAAHAAGFQTTLHIVAVPLKLALVRVRLRVQQGGHAVPTAKQRERYLRLWGLLAQAIQLADQTLVYDNTRADRAYHAVARFERGRLIGAPQWPDWLPPALRQPPPRVYSSPTTPPSPPTPGASS